MTTPRRTIVDLEQTLEPYLVRRARRQAEFMKFKLKLPTDRSRSDLESDFLAFLADHGFPPPEVNVKVGKHRVDFLWRAGYTVRRYTGVLGRRPVPNSSHRPAS